jgi:hypothetical protein
VELQVAQALAILSVAFSVTITQIIALIRVHLALAAHLNHQALIRVHHLIALQAVAIIPEVVHNVVAVARVHSIGIVMEHIITAYKVKIVANYLEVEQIKKILGKSFFIFNI